MSKYEVGQRLQVICESIDENGKAKFRVVNEGVLDNIKDKINDVKENKQISKFVKELHQQFREEFKQGNLIPVDIYSPKHKMTGWEWLCDRYDYTLGRDLAVPKELGFKPRTSAKAFKFFECSVQTSNEEIAQHLKDQLEDGEEIVETLAACTKVVMDRFDFDNHIQIFSPIVGYTNKGKTFCISCKPVKTGTNAAVKATYQKIKVYSPQQSMLINPKFVASAAMTKPGDGKFFAVAGGKYSVVTSAEMLSPGDRKAVQLAQKEREQKQLAKNM